MLLSGSRTHHLSRVRKVPLAGFLVNGEEAPASELLVANGLDVTKENLLALRYSQKFIAEVSVLNKHSRLLVACKSFLRSGMCVCLYARRIR